MSGPDLQRKFRNLAEPVIGAEQSARLQSLCLGVMELHDVALLAAAARVA